MPRYLVTQEGIDFLREELKRLKQEERPQIVRAIAEARAHGDLRENAEYHAAKERQGFIEGRINDLESKLSYAEVIDVTKIPNRGKVIFGATVFLHDSATEEKITYRIVGEDESDLTNGKISYISPVARLLIGKNKGDTVIIELPNQNKEFIIIDVSYQ